MKGISWSKVKWCSMSDFIYNQKKIPKGQWRYGLRASAATGCGWIATYNALFAMGYREKPERLIRYFERQLPLIHGNLGTFLLGPVFYFKKHGFSVRLVKRRSSFDDAVKNSDVAIVFYYWRQRMRFGAHFVAVRYQEGEFVGYNTFRTSAGPDYYGASLEAFLKKRKYFGCVLIAIQDR